MKHLNLKPMPLTTWRKIALGSWRSVGDPSVYGSVHIRAEKIQKRQAEYTQRTGKTAPSLTAVLTIAIAKTMQKNPQINGLIRWGRIYLRDTVTIFLQAAVDKHGNELSGVVIQQAEKKTLEEISDELIAKAHAIRTDQDKDFKRVKASFKLVPSFLMRYVMNFMSYLLFTLNLDLRIIGMPRDPFGAVMITNIGSLGLEEGYVPLVPYSRVPLLLAVGKVVEMPVVEDHQVRVGHAFKICTTFDHRFIDGIHGAKMLKTLRHYLETETGLNELGL